MILTLLAIVGALAIPAITFLCGVWGIVEAMRREAPDLYTEWMNRRNAGRAAK